MSSVRQKLSFVLFIVKAASAEGARNGRFSASKVSRFNLVPSDTMAPKRIYWNYTNIWSVAQTTEWADVIEVRPRFSI